MAFDNHPLGVMPSASSAMLQFGMGVPPECFAARQLALVQGRECRKRSDQMRLRAVAVALAVAIPLLAVASTPAAAFGW
jgi:hypothetical protein